MSTGLHAIQHRAFFHGLLGRFGQTAPNGRWLAAVLLLTSALLLAATDPSAAQTPQIAGPLLKGPTVLVAESLRQPLDAIATAWAAKSSKQPVLVYAASDVLAKQIEGGMPADIVIEGDLKLMDGLGKAGLINTHTRRSIIGNALVLIAKADSTSTLKIATGFDLAGATGEGKIAVCMVETCPAGEAAKQALGTLEIWPSVEPKLIQTVDGAAAVALVAKGDAKFGIVLASDAKAEPKVKVVDTFAGSTYQAIVFPIALIKESKHPDAPAFMAFMRSGEATRILTGQGFSVLK